MIITCGYKHEWILISGECHSTIIVYQVADRCFNSTNLVPTCYRLIMFTNAGVTRVAGNRVLQMWVVFLFSDPCL